MKIPALLYEALPYLYVLLGVADIIYFQHYNHSGLGVFSGVLFILSAYFVDKLRFNYRNGIRWRLEI